VLGSGGSEEGVGASGAAGHPLVVGASGHHGREGLVLTSGGRRVGSNLGCGQMGSRRQLLVMAGQWVMPRIARVLQKVLRLLKDSGEKTNPSYYIFY
jgi:hypothetical protein